MHVMPDGDETVLGNIPVVAGQLHLQRGDILNLVSQGLGSNARPACRNKRARPATIACTLPEALASVRKGDHIWFDDGRIGGVVRRGGAKGLVLEITDAAMGGRAECVMLNKGPHILHAMRTLDDILRRMQAHQSKKRPLLRALKSWNLPWVAARIAIMQKTRTRKAALLPENQAHCKNPP